MTLTQHPDFLWGGDFYNLVYGGVCGKLPEPFDCFWALPIYNVDAKFRYVEFDFDQQTGNENGKSEN